MKFHFHAFSLNHEIKPERFLKFLNLIDLSDFRGSRTILTLHFSIIH